MKVWRLAKAMIGTAVTWGFAWSVVAVPTLIMLLRGPLGDYSAWDLTRQWATHTWVHAFAQGAVFGLGFAVLLRIAASRVRSFERLNMWLVSGAGAIAATGICYTVLGAGFGVINAAMVAALGAGSGAASLAIARRVPAQSGSLELDSRNDAKLGDSAFAEIRNTTFTSDSIRSWRARFGNILVIASWKPLSVQCQITIIDEDRANAQSAASRRTAPRAVPSAIKSYGDRRCRFLRRES